jgi:peptide deformylase
MYEVRIYGDPILRVKAKTVTKFDERLRTLAQEMTETMREKDGVGLAATQVGISQRMIVIDPSGGEKEPIVLVNPEITEFSEESEEHEEGCLSFPGFSLKITRPAIVSAKAQDTTGREFTIENADGLLARVLQHEIDHLNALLIIDRISLLQRQLISGKLKKLVRDQSENLQPA